MTNDEKITPASECIDAEAIRRWLDAMWPELARFREKWKYEQLISVPDGPEWAIQTINDLGERLARAACTIDADREALRAAMEEIERLEQDKSNKDNVIDLYTSKLVDSEATRERAEARLRALDEGVMCRNCITLGNVALRKDRISCAFCGEPVAARAEGKNSLNKGNQ